jgi:predicted RND superfamily exporter protein
LILEKIQRLSSYASLVILAALPMAAIYAWKLRLGTEYVEKWLPSDSPSKLRYADFSSRFGETQPLLFSWRGANLDDPRLGEAANYLLEQWSQHPEWPLLGLTHGKQSIELLRENLRGISTDEAISRLSGQTVGHDGASVIILQLKDPAPHYRDQIIEACHQAASLVKIPRRDVVLAGEAFQTYQIDRYSRISVQRYIPLSMVMCFGFAWLSLRNWRLTVMVMVLAGLGQLFGMALISLLVGQMGAILIVVPTLLFMLTLSAAVHLTHYFISFHRSAQPFPGCHAVRVGIFPCMMAACTTAFGFASLSLSDLEPVYLFGVLAAAGMIVCTLSLLSIFIPAVRVASFKMDSIPPNLTYVSHIIENLLNFIFRRGTWIVVSTLTLFIFCLLGLTRLTATTRFDGMFNPSHPAIQSLRWIEEHLGPIETLEFLVNFTESTDRADILKQFSVVQNLESKLQSHPRVHSTFSATCILPRPPQEQGTRATIRRAVFRNFLSSELDQLADAQLIHKNDSEVSWRITLRFKTLSDADFRPLLLELEHMGQNEIIELTSVNNLVSPPTLQVTGLRTVIESANQILLNDLAGSFAVAFLLITPFMMITVRSFWGGIVLMLPNIVPVVFVFGVMGWMAVPLDVASILTASVALGIAVDDTLHCIVWYLRSRKNGASPQSSVEHAIKRCSRAMVHTTLICSGAMIPFLFCEFLPTSKFALLLILILTSAVVSDLIFLPALLCSPLGRWIGNPRKFAPDFKWEIPK